MSKLITKDTLQDGQIFQVERLTIDELPILLELQTKVIHSLVKKDVLQPLSVEEFTTILNGKGFIIGVFFGGKLIAFRAMLEPVLDEEHLGIDAGLIEEELLMVIYQEISNVDPAYQGNGLQTYMGNLVMKLVDKERFRYVCATVAPFNIPSLKDKFALGLEIVSLDEKYEGKLRYTFIKDLTSSLNKRLINDETLIPMGEIEEQQRLLQSGLRGTAMKEISGK